MYGSDPEGRLGEYPRPELRAQGRISGACFDAALGNIDKLTIMGTRFPTPDGTCIRDYIHVTDLVDAHVTVLAKALRNPPALYNVGTGKGYSVREFVDTCKAVTGKDIKVRRGLLKTVNLVGRAESAATGPTALNGFWRT